MFVSNIKGHIKEHDSLSRILPLIYLLKLPTNMFLQTYFHL